MLRAVNVARASNFNVRNSDVINKSLSNLRPFTNAVLSKSFSAVHKSDCGCSTCLSRHYLRRNPGDQTRSYNSFAKTHCNGCECKRCLSTSVSNVRAFSNVASSKNTSGLHKSDCSCSTCLNVHSNNCSCHLCKYPDYQTRSYHFLGKTHGHECKCKGCLSTSVSNVRAFSNVASSKNTSGLYKTDCSCSACLNLHSNNCLCHLCKNPGYQTRSYHFLGKTHGQGCKCKVCVSNIVDCPCDACAGRRMLSTKTDARKTCLYDLHVENQGKIVDFAGWLLPVQYKDAIAASHQHTRNAASVFDVGHMLQTRVSGKAAGEFLESLTTSDLRNLANGRACLTVFTNETGGILDDLIITKDSDDKFFVVSNAGRRTEDSQLLLQQLELFKSQGKQVSMDFLDPLEQGLVAVQGPSAHEALQNFTTVNLKDLKFMQSVETEVFGTPIRISRCGYTGEDGFEVSLPEKIAKRFVEQLLTFDDVKLAGLGARDSLRLEAGLCLYGHDIDETTTPVEAGLTWLIAKRRREEMNFPGAKKILSQIKSKPAKRRVGLVLGQGPPAREGTPILTTEGERVGVVTSGGPSPSLGRPVAMGYLPLDLTQPGNGTLVEIRGKTYKAIVAKMPFVKTNYYTG